MSDELTKTAARRLKAFWADLTLLLKNADVLNEKDLSGLPILRPPTDSAPDVGSPSTVETEVVSGTPVVSPEIPGGNGGTPPEVAEPPTQVAPQGVPPQQVPMPLPPQPGMPPQQAGAGFPGQTPPQNVSWGATPVQDQSQHPQPPQPLQQPSQQPMRQNVPSMPSPTISAAIQTLYESTDNALDIVNLALHNFAVQQNIQITGLGDIPGHLETHFLQHLEYAKQNPNG